MQYDLDLLGRIQNELKHLGKFELVDFLISTVQELGDPNLYPHNKITARHKLFAARMLIVDSFRDDCFKRQDEET